MTELTNERAEFEAAARRDPYAIYGFALFADGKMRDQARTYLDTKTEAAWGIWKAARRATVACGKPPTSECALPPLPEPTAIGYADGSMMRLKYGYTAEQVEQIRREAVEADRRGQLEYARTLGYELAGVIADVEQGHGFDDVCLETIKRVRASLAAPAQGKE
jgi:hypothetical protein